LISVPTYFRKVSLLYAKPIAGASWYSFSLNLSGFSVQTMSLRAGLGSRNLANRMGAESSRGHSLVTLTCDYLALTWQSEEEATEVELRSSVVAEWDLSVSHHIVLLILL